MPINNPDEYEKVVNVSWYVPEQETDQLTFPCVLPFSQMYPLCCIDIRNFLNQIYLFSDENFSNPSIIDDTLRTTLDELLSERVCDTLVAKLSSQYPGQIVQILTNLDHFETACKELQNLLVEARSSSSAAGPITLNATTKFTEAKKSAEKRIFELVNSKIDDLIETAEYDWTSTHVPADASPYMQELTRYLSNIMHTVLLGLPITLKSLIYFDALSHISEALLKLPLEAHIKTITPQAATAFKLDGQYLANFVKGMGDRVLEEGLDELVQTVDLMSMVGEVGREKAEEEFFDMEKARKRFSKVDKMTGAELLEK